MKWNDKKSLYYCCDVCHCFSGSQWAEDESSVPKMFYRRFSDQSNLYVGMKRLCSARTIVCRNRFSSSEGESRELFLENVVNVHQSLNRVIRNACREVLASIQWFLVFYKCWRSLWFADDPSRRKKALDHAIIYSLERRTKKFLDHPTRLGWFLKMCILPISALLPYLRIWDFTQLMRSLTRCLHETLSRNFRSLLYTILKTLSCEET